MKRIIVSALFVMPIIIQSAELKMITMPAPTENTTKPAELTMNYFEILGLSRSAENQQIRTSYKKQALKWHPDKNHSPYASDVFKRLTTAQETLLDPKKRMQYEEEQNTPPIFRTRQKLINAIKTKKIQDFKINLKESATLLNEETKNKREELLNWLVDQNLHDAINKLTPQNIKTNFVNALKEIFPNIIYSNTMGLQTIESWGDRLKKATLLAQTQNNFDEYIEKILPQLKEYLKLIPEDVSNSLKNEFLMNLPTNFIKN